MCRRYPYLVFGVTLLLLTRLLLLARVLIRVGVAQLVQCLGQFRYALVLLELVVDRRDHLLADQHEVAQVQQLVLRDPVVDVQLVRDLQHLVLRLARAATLLGHQALGEVLADLGQVLRVVRADRHGVRGEQQRAARNQREWSAKKTGE